MRLRLRVRVLLAATVLTAGTLLPVGATGGTASATPAPVRTGVASEAIAVERVSGPTRIDTAVAVSRRLHARHAAGGAVLARADVLADALAAVPLAAAMDGPLLLTGQSELPAAVLAEIHRAVGPGGRIVVTGGSAAVSAAVVERLLVEGFEVDRIAGSDRVATSVAIAEELRPLRGTPTTAVIVSATSQIDASTASAVAARNGWPVLLSHGDRLSPLVATYLDTVEDVVLIGGPHVLGEQVRRDADSHVRRTSRIAGADRYQTSLEVLRRFATKVDTVVLAGGAAVPDALVAATLASVRGSALLLVPVESPPPSSRDALGATRARRVVVVGGEERVGDRAIASVVNSLRSVLDELLGTNPPHDDAPAPGEGGATPPPGDGTPDPEPRPSTSPAGEWPGPSNTGPTDESVLRRVDSITTVRDGQLIEDVEVHGRIKVQHSNVRIRNVRVLGTSDYGIYVPSWKRSEVSGLVIEDTEIRGVSGSRLAGLAEYSDWTARRLDVSGYQDAVKMSSDQVLEDSWIHDFHYSDGSHNDGIQSIGGSNSVVRGNRIDGPTHQTSALMLQANFGAIENWVVEGNRFSGGGYTVYITDKDTGHGPPRDVTVRDNVWVRGSWDYGPLRLHEGPDLHWEGNTYDDGATFRP